MRSKLGKSKWLKNNSSNIYKTKTVSNKESKGRHTTTSRELIQIDNGAMLIDTPGMREIGNLLVDTGIDETFSEVVDISMSCKFSNCSHTNSAAA